MKLLTALVFVFCFVQFSNISAEQVVLNTNNYPPYQVVIDGKLSGIAIEALNCTFRKLNMEYLAKVVPWKRARLKTIKGSVQGYFAIMQDKEMDAKAVMSNPLFLEKWYWYYKADTSSKKSISTDLKKLRIGAILGSNEETWLKDAGYEIKVRAKTTPQLIKLFKKKRIEAFLANKSTFDKVIKKEGGKNIFASKFVKYTPLGVYFSKAFIKAKPDFLKSFNNAVFPCVPDVMALSSNDRVALKSISHKIKKWAGHSRVIKAIKSQNSKYTKLNQADVIQLDKKWRAEKKSSSRPLINKTLANNLSLYLKEIKKISKGLYSEIFVMDNKGLNVGQSNITSDYWQGDEAKFKKTFNKGSNAVFIDDVEYDESSRKFQSQVSLTIVNPDTNKPIGAITVGIDIESALRQE